MEAINVKAFSGANEAQIMNTIRRQGPISRVDIARLTGLTAPTVTNITGKLIEAGIISEHMIGEYSGGRRPVLLKANPEVARMVVADVRSKEIIGYVVNSGLEIKKRITQDIHSLDKDAVLAALNEIIAACCSSEEGHRAVALGIIVRGPVRSTEGVSLFSPVTGWRNVPLKFITEERFHLPTFVENDMRVTTLGIYHYGPYREIKNAIFLGVGGGIGSGIIINGELYRGKGDSAGEIGHSMVDIAGPICSCKNYGCLEAMASETALVNNTIKAITAGEASLITEMTNGDTGAIKVEHIYSAASEGDGLALRMLGDIARYLGIGAANLINIFDPELIIVGGGIVRARNFIEEIMLNEMKERALESCSSTVSVEFSSDVREAALKGTVDVIMQGMVAVKG